MNLCLFFTFDISLKDWVRSGLFDREVKIYRELVGRGMSVSFFTWGDDSDLEYVARLEGIKVIPMYAGRKRPKSKIARYFCSFWLPWRMRTRWWAFDLFKTNQLWGGWAPALAARIAGKPLLLRCGYEFYFSARRQGKSIFKLVPFFWVSWLLYRLADKIEVTSAGIADFVTNTYGIPRNKIAVVPNYIDTGKFVMRTQSSRSDRLLFVGRFTEEKNVDLLFDLIGGAGRGIDLVGGGPLDSHLRSRAREESIDARFLGTLPNDELPALMAQYRFFILSSKFEGNPKALLEAMACGLIAIGANVPGIRDLIDNGENGFLFEPTLDSFRQALASADSCDQARVSAAAVKSVLDNNEFSRVVESEIGLYRMLVGVGT